MSKFKVGDRVKDTTRFVGKLGTVIGFSGFNDVPLIEYDDTIPGGHNGNTSEKSGKHGKNGHCWYAENGVKLVLANSAPRNWKLVIAPDKSDADVTNATMYVDGKVVRIDSVRRYHKDMYNVDAAITAALAKRNAEFPKAKPEPLKSEPPKPIMINGVELKAGCRILLKPYNEDAACGVGERNWNRLYYNALVVKKISCGTHVVIEDPDKDGSTWHVKLEAVDRILQE